MAREMVERAIKSAENLEIAVRGIVLELKPKPEHLLEVTMRVLAEDDRLESLREKAGEEEGRIIEEALEKIKGMKRSLLRVYFTSAMLGKSKPKFVPAITLLRREKNWLALQRMK